MSGNEQNVSTETRAWLADRHRPGNWYDIDPAEEIPSDVGAMRSILHMFQVAFGPEVRQRTEDGRIDRQFVLTTAQLLQPEDRPNVVRLNEEVRGMAAVRVSRPVLAGGAVNVADLRGLEDFDLDPSELDAGHFTVFWVGNGWRAIFDFRSGRGKAAGMLEAATEFLEAAKWSAQRGDARVSVDTLFSASELVAKTHLILRPGRSILKTHQSVSTAFNQWARLGNVGRGFRELFNRMSNQRAAARYNAAVVDLPSGEDLALLEAEISSLNRSIAHRIEEAKGR